MPVWTSIIIGEKFGFQGDFPWLCLYGQDRASPGRPICVPPTLEVLSTPRLYYSGEIVKDNYCLRVLMRDERFPAHVFAHVNSPG